MGYGVWGRLTGSSPRTWGTQSEGPPASPKNRFIPTHVGNTGMPLGVFTSKAVHPHARGEHGFNFAYARAYCGSSPRTWGTREQLRVKALSTRFIPTHVGNTRAGQPGPGAVCGSSPRTWGTLLPGGLPRVVGRFIPTHVGNT